MKRGDLIRVLTSCDGLNFQKYREGQVGIVLGFANDPHNAAHGCMSVLFENGVIEDFGNNMVEVISGRVIK